MYYLCYMVQSYTVHGRGGFGGHGRVYSNLPYIFFFNKGFGNVEDMLYLRVVMNDRDLIPHLKNNRKFIKRLNKMMGERPITFSTKSNYYRVSGTPKIGFCRDGSLTYIKITFTVTHAEVLYSGRTEFTKVSPDYGSRAYKRACRFNSNDVRTHVYNTYLKHLGLSEPYLIKVTMSWGKSVPL